MVKAVDPVNSSSANTFSRADWQKGYRSLPQEYAYWIDEIEGEIPADLEGTLFRNGPGLLDRNGQEYGHPFDGDGMVCAFSFSNGKAHFANSYVKTPEFLAEQKAGKILYRGVFGTQKPGGWLNNIFDLRLKNIANTNVIYHGEKLMALWEADRPYRLDPTSLDTIGMESFDGKLSPGQAFTAHPKLDPKNGDLWAFGVEAGPKSTINIYRVDRGGNLHQPISHRIPGFSFLHDFAITPNYCIFMQNPVKFDPIPMVLGLKTAAACIDLKPNTPSQLLLCDRQDNLITLETDPCFVFHHCNAFEQGDEIILDSVCYDDYPKLKDGADYKNIEFNKVIPAQLCRFTINPATGQVCREVLVSRSCEFPVVHPDYVGQPYRYVYIGAIAQETGNAPLQAILKFDHKTGEQQIHSFAPRKFISEPIFVPRPDHHPDRPDIDAADRQEDHGWLLVLVFDGEHERSDLVILDAANITNPPIATLHLKHHIPYGLHGNFTPEVWV
ncbi:9-cis-epoxycarotenoid dioxygenase [Thalassoporum mexicanum PCC 7367]|uniref:carotenoid oxygenase family protein n=1 Tax=Thalassoporum mexicanum TaxID=3457544 RepID=UPI00029FC262|nr:carotenoid oxygenase family protein [Pseudanabaena sp. PCC 7367]AFY69985.1 9-cis-epoxycarotenoid dioxygenase [Pseudanabaena sp. PCC 7367]